MAGEEKVKETSINVKTMISYLDSLKKYLSSLKNQENNQDNKEKNLDLIKQQLFQTKKEFQNKISSDNLKKLKTIVDDQKKSENNIQKDDITFLNEIIEIHRSYDLSYDGGNFVMRTVKSTLTNAAMSVGISILKTNITNESSKDILDLLMDLPQAFNSYIGSTLNEISVLLNENNSINSEEIKNKINDLKKIFQTEIFKYSLEKDSEASVKPIDILLAPKANDDNKKKFPLYEMFDLLFNSLESEPVEKIFNIIKNINNPNKKINIGEIITENIFSAANEIDVPENQKKNLNKLIEYFEINALDLSGKPYQIFSNKKNIENILKYFEIKNPDTKISSENKEIFDLFFDTFKLIEKDDVKFIKINKENFSKFNEKIFTKVEDRNIQKILTDSNKLINLIFNEISTKDTIEIEITDKNKESLKEILKTEYIDEIINKYTNRDEIIKENLQKNQKFIEICLNFVNHLNPNQELKKTFLRIIEDLSKTSFGANKETVTFASKILFNLATGRFNESSGSIKALIEFIDKDPNLKNDFIDLINFFAEDITYNLSVERADEEKNEPLSTKTINVKQETDLIIAIDEFERTKLIKRQESQDSGLDSSSSDDESEMKRRESKDSELNFSNYDDEDRAIRKNSYNSANLDSDDDDETEEEEVFKDAIDNGEFDKIEQKKFLEQRKFLIYSGKQIVDNDFVKEALEKLLKSNKEKSNKMIDALFALNTENATDLMKQKKNDIKDSLKKIALSIEHTKEENLEIKIQDFLDGSNELLQATINYNSNKISDYEKEKILKLNENAFNFFQILRAQASLNGKIKIKNIDYFVAVIHEILKNDLIYEILADNLESKSDLYNLETIEELHKKIKDLENEKHDSKKQMEDSENNEAKLKQEINNLKKENVTLKKINAINFNNKINDVKEDNLKNKSNKYLIASGSSMTISFTALISGAVLKDKCRINRNEFYTLLSISAVALIIGIGCFAKAMKVNEKIEFSSLENVSKNPEIKI